MLQSGRPVQYARTQRLIEARCQPVALLGDAGVPGALLGEDPGDELDRQLRDAEGHSARDPVVAVDQPAVLDADRLVQAGEPAGWVFARDDVGDGRPRTQHAPGGAPVGVPGNMAGGADERRFAAGQGEQFNDRYGGVHGRHFLRRPLHP